MPNTNLVLETNNPLINEKHIRKFESSGKNQ